MTTYPDPVQDANDSAGRAARAWLIAVGLATEVDAVRFPDGFSPVPAPGLDSYLSAAERAAADASLRADRVAALSADPGAIDATLEASAETFIAAAGAEHAARQMAQLALGVSAHLIGDDRVERLDRAAVAVLHPPAGSGRPVGLIEDGMVLEAKARPEAVVEIAGAICRLLIDRNTRLVVTAQTGESVELTVDADDTLCATTESARVDPDDGWEADDHGGWVADWPSPVTVREPAGAVAAALIANWALSQGDVRVEVSPCAVHSAA